MNFLILVNGFRQYVSKVDFVDFANSSFRSRIQAGTLTADRQLNAPDKTGTIALLSDIGDFKAQALQGYPLAYKEITKSVGVLTAVNWYATSAKTIHLLSTAFTYTSGTVTQIIFTNIRTGTTKTVVFGYPNANLTTIEAS